MISGKTSKLFPTLYSFLSLLNSRHPTVCLFCSSRLLNL